MAKSNSLGVRLDPEYYAALKMLADRDRRSMSQMIAKVVSDWIEETLKKEGLPLRPADEG